MSQAIRRVDGSEQGVMTADIPDERPISQVIVETVAAVKGIEPNELSMQLYDSFNPEALDSLCETARKRGEPLRISFTFVGCEITIVSEQGITIRESPDDRSPSQ